MVCVVFTVFIEWLYILEIMVDIYGKEKDLSKVKVSRLWIRSFFFSPAIAFFFFFFLH